MVKINIKDHFFYKAKKNGYLARSYYKLQEADRKYAFIKPGMRILDLGCSPGSWIEYCLQKVGSRGQIIGVDRNELKRRFKSLTFIQSDIFGLTPSQLLGNGGPFDLVLSDMAPDTMGSSMVDAYRSFELSKCALELACRTLKKSGAFFCKIFQGSEFKLFLDETRLYFSSVKVFKPKSSRKTSREVYVLGLGKLKFDECQHSDT
jgi:23S rRNA (uridine2552-2'-O)-methyltransferase